MEAEDGIEGSDYINANYISGEVKNSFHYYIACQAPLESTMNDFWRMMWEQRIGVIVMLTSLEEGHLNKAHCYWPEEGKVKKFGKLLVCHKKSFRVGEIIVRSLLVRLVAPDASSSATREIIQLQYEGWPDFGAPSSTKSIRDLIVLMTKFRARAASSYALEGPIAIHCSAGLGRTGAYVACHITLEKLRHNEPANIRQTVELMRKQRAGMVRNEIQYSLIYAVVRDALKSGLLKELTASCCSPTSSSNQAIRRSISSDDVLLPDSPVGSPRRDTSPDRELRLS